MLPFISMAAYLSNDFLNPCMSFCNHFSFNLCSLFHRYIRLAFKTLKYKQNK